MATDNMEHLENDDIQEQMAVTRASLEQKLETLEQKVVGTVENATTAVNETVEVIKDTVQETVTTVNESVKDGVETVKGWLDVSEQVREHPWGCVGASMLAGCVLGALTGKRTVATAAFEAMRSNALRGEPVHHNGGSRPVRREAERSTLLDSWGPEIDKLKALAIGALFGTARELITQNLSEHVGRQLKEVIDSVTKKVGGEPLAKCDWVSTSESSHQSQRESHSHPQPGQQKEWPEDIQPAGRRW